MLWLAVKTLLHEKVRFFITLLGITVAGVLALIEIAIYLGMMANATAVIRHTDADIWVASKNIQSFDFALPFPAGRINQVRAFSDVLWAEKLLLSWGFVKLANGEGAS
jgi:putative ABC transport system permease protein